MVAHIFIDGEAGTTGLQIRERLATRSDLRLISLDESRRKDPSARAEALNSADVVILCLPDDAAREAVGLIRAPHVRVIDASTAHRVAPGWVYGFAELAPDQRRCIAEASRVTNPGCWPTGFLALVRPLTREGLLPADASVFVHGVSGYTGGGKAMIAEFEGPDSVSAPAFRFYAANLGHKHVPEMTAYSGLARPPVFSPAVGCFAQGMLVEVPLDLAALPGTPSLDQVHAVLADAYADARLVTVVPRSESAARGALAVEGLAGRNDMNLYVFGSETLGQARLVAALDNLGKGASGAAVQNLNLMLGLDEGEGL
jgi:N-acetyl-gamma-glutamyl-phosphate reductase